MGLDFYEFFIECWYGLKKGFVFLGIGVEMKICGVIIDKNVCIGCNV